MNVDLEELAVECIDCQDELPLSSGYYYVTWCDDKDNIIKWHMVYFCCEENLFFSLVTLTEIHKTLEAPKFWKSSAFNDRKP